MLLTSLFLLISSNALSIRKDISIFYSRLGIVILFLSIITCYNNTFIYYLNSSIALFGGLFFISAINLTFSLFIFILSSFILNLTSFYPNMYKYTIPSVLINKISIYKELYSIIEYTLIILFVIMGSLLLISSNDLISIYLSLELQSYGLYILCTLYRNSESATSSGLTYFLLGGLSSCLILLGISLIYANSGTTQLDSFYTINNLSYILKFDLNTDVIVSEPYISYALLLIYVGLLFKISAAPFHFWSPDVYDGVPTVVTTFIAIIPKISIFIVLLYIVHFSYDTNISTYNYSISILLISSVLSLIIGAILGLTQFRIKRLFAYSTISHVGFILLALSINTVESIQSFIFYIIQYSISNLNVFFILIAIGYTLYSYYGNINANKFIDKNNSPIQLKDQLKGYFYINPWLSLCLIITLLSFAGIPPFIGFFAKLLVLSSAMQNGFIFITLIGILTSVISTVYYLDIIKTMFFYTHNYKNYLNKKTISNSIYDVNTFTLSNKPLSNSLSITISIFTLFILLFIFLCNEWINLSNILSFILFIPFYNI